MSEIAAETSGDAPEIRRLTFDLDVEVCVIGGGLAGLSVALEAAQMGASVALLESRRIGWGASGNNLGTVMPGFDVSAETIIARIGRRAAGELWRMSHTGAEIVRSLATPMADIALSEGVLRVSGSARGDRALDGIMALGSDFGIDAQSWATDHLRDVLDTKHYFKALHHRRAFQIDGAVYLRGLIAMVRQAGVRIFEETPATALELSGTRKRITTPAALLRAQHVVLAGNTHLGAALPRLAATLLPVWRFGAVTEPLGNRLEAAIAFTGSIIDTDGIDHFRAIEGGRLMWSSPETTWQASPRRFAGPIQRRMRQIFPELGKVRIAETFGGSVGCTVHGMPQIGQLRPGVWVASGFGRHGLNTTAMAGRIVARGILHGDDRWRLFGPFDLIWAGGRTGQVAGFAIEWASRRSAAVAGAWARRREVAVARDKIRDARIAAVSRRAPPEPSRSGQNLPDPPQIEAPRDPLPPSPFLEMPDVRIAAAKVASQESERESRPTT